tara:strand:+ start:4798 stop:5082 length:285 start_codon:yes stop_codon:yes gene_type:complete
MSFLDAKKIIEEIFTDLEKDQVFDLMSIEDEQLRITANIFNAGCHYEFETYNDEGDLEEAEPGCMVFYLSMEDARVAIEQNNKFYQEYRKSILN